ncbi:autotransporter outer membrane beta-barrel domain-containing protein [Aquabacter cavernae]|uniref:autotransporter outer membrane beta-barrel domain-containing protein n=1 Tax=Aquabacter cavernae TaxID=2496029 RepID=UPI000F8E4CD3|nr:autotransporter outer membrane beta-barrel domain-containing protein [Aquabacter cavernae]
MQGQNGEHGSSFAFYTKEATPGTKADGYSGTFSAPITGVKDSAIKITSTGGRGGTGEWGTINNIAGANGGDGGAITVTVGAPVSGGSSHDVVVRGRVVSTTETPLISLLSKGGRGGGGFVDGFFRTDEGRFSDWEKYYKAQGISLGDYLAANFAPVGIGAGGKADNVTFTLLSEVNAVGNSVPAIKLVSEGGPAGDDRGGTTEYRAQMQAGGVAGKVEALLQRSSKVTTAGNDSPAVILSSLGGAGGVATGNTSTYYATNGGNGGVVTFTNHGAITTTGINSTAVLLQSIGGKGGNGGGGAFTSAAPGAIGGNGGDVTGTNTGAITTGGDYSFGILAQSVSGAGGLGARAALAGSGGAGGATGTAGTVTVTNSGTITTGGAEATAILAQSVGGGKATGSIGGKVIATVGASGGSGGILFFGAGGDGGTGGTGKNVTVTNSGTITTTAEKAVGILAQSIGGGGGGGGSVTAGGIIFTLTLGGSGGNGGGAGEVTVNNRADAGAARGSIVTKGDYATGILAQSVGGGGGSGGNATALNLGPIVSIAHAVGGDAGSGATGGKVTVNNALNVSTDGFRSAAISATSVGGGGGNGGQATAVSVALGVVPEVPAISIASGVGGKGGEGSTGGAVTVVNDAALVTKKGASSGIVAISVGGGGGSGGTTDSHAWMVAPMSPGTVTEAMSAGGSGGKGNKGGDVTVTNHGFIQTLGEGFDGMMSSGITAYSIGGGGGAGGGAWMRAQDTVNTSSFSMSARIGVGGSGGEGNSGGTVKVTNTGSIETKGIDAIGVHAMSVGGGGGDGGVSRIYEYSGLLGAAATLGGLANVSQSLGFNGVQGGTGGSGGTGGVVSVTNSGRIATHALGATGILAQSIGGGGGKGGDTVMKAASSVTYNEVVGGSGGSGNTGGTVTVTTSAGSAIATHGEGAYGIFAQSIGGGGGAGGTSLSASGGDSVTSSQEFTTASKTLVYSLKTTLYNAFQQRGLFEQAWITGQIKNWALIGGPLSKMLTTKPNVPVSISLNRSTGGTGGEGGNGGEVTITNAGSITTDLATSHGLFAQSIGGGGGDGGKAETSAGQIIAIKSSVGGSGSRGGVGNTVTVTNERGSIITTGGSSAFGIAAQSIGGGGGSAAMGIDLQADSLFTTVMAAASPLVTTLSSHTGGQGGIGGVGGQVTVKNGGIIATEGNQAHGIFAQSVGGGGGLTIVNGYDPNIWLTTVDLLKQALGVNALEILRLDMGVDIRSQVALATDIASGKVGVVTAYGLSLGGAGPGTGDGDTVTVQNTGVISTSGKSAFGIAAQSIGGGGGFVSDGVLSGPGVGAALIGGSGGARGNGKSVDIRMGDGAVISTTGDYASAVFAQSIGGGGGYAGGGVSTGQTAAVIGGVGGSDGWGGRVTFGLEMPQDARFTISTTGKAAHGIFAQSIGGGGGFAGTFVDARANVRTDVIDRTQTALAALVKSGAIKTSDDWLIRTPATENVSASQRARLLDVKEDALKAAGLEVGSTARSLLTALAADSDTFAALQSKLTQLANNRSLSTGTGGEIRIDLGSNSTIMATGANAFGVYAQSGFQALNGALDPSHAGQNITIQSRGIIVGGSEGGAAIGIDGGYDNQITVSRGSTVSAVSGKAILGSFGNETVVNYGTVIGDINLSYGGGREWNSFDNRPGGIYRTSASGIVNLGAGNSFTNNGTFDINGVGTFGTAEVTGRFRQSREGTLLVDVSSATATTSAQNDLLKVTGDLALSGTVQTNVVGGLKPGSFTIATATDRAEVSKAQVKDGGYSPFSWQIAQKGGKDVVITPSANIAAPSGVDMTATEDRVMREAQAVWASGTVTDTQGVLFGLLANSSSQDDFIRAIDSVAPGESQSATTLQSLGSMKSLNAALSCPVFEGSGTLMQETDCSWARIIGNWTQQSASGDTTGYDQTAVTYRIGAQKELIDGWFFGATAGLTQSWLTDSNDLSSTDGLAFDTALSLKRQLGPWLFSVAGHFGVGSYDTDRVLDVGPAVWTSSGRGTVITGAARFRASYEFAFADWYVRPYADLDVLYNYAPAHEEQGFGPMNLAFGSAQAWNLAVSPNIEFGGRVNIDASTWLRPYASVGVSFFANDGLQVPTSLVGSNGATVMSFMTESAMPQTLLNLTAGAQLYSTKGFEIRAEYKADIADNFLSQEASARLAIPF